MINQKIYGPKWSWPIFRPYPHKWILRVSALYTTSVWQKHIFNMKADAHLCWLFGSYSVDTVSVKIGSSLPWKYSAPENRFKYCENNHHHDNNSKSLNNHMLPTCIIPRKCGTNVYVNNVCTLRSHKMIYALFLSSSKKCKC